MPARVWWVTKSANRILVPTVIDPLSDDLAFSLIPPPPYVAASTRTFAGNRAFLPRDEADKAYRLYCTSDGTLSRRDIEHNAKGIATRFHSGATRSAIEQSKPNAGRASACLCKHELR
jgi:hypothetical protein